MNEIRIMAPMGTKGAFGVTLFVEFKGGLIEVISEDENIEVSINSKLSRWEENEGVVRNYGYSVQFPTQGYVNANPLDKEKFPFEAGASRIFHTLTVGTEYYLNINAYNFSNENTPIVWAQLRLVVIEDKQLFEVFEDPALSWCVSVELISYEYSDIYKFMDEVWDDED